MNGWAIDLGNSHTRVARWDREAGEPRLLELEAICRRPGGEEPLEAPRLIPSATQVLDRPSWKARLGSVKPVSRRWFLGRLALIGRPALEANHGHARASFVPAFKPYLEREALRPLARAGRRSFNARDIALLFLRELLVEVKRTTGHRIRDLVLTHPVEAFESYRAELVRIGAHLGIHRLRFLDEPVAAALGYGLGLARDRLVLVVDFGAGTLHLALVMLSVKGVREGHATVIAKEGRAIGGHLVNRWLYEEVARRIGLPTSVDPSEEEAVFWQRLMLAEVCRAKEALFFRPHSTLRLSPPAHLRRLVPDGSAAGPLVDLSREHLVEVLRTNGLYRTLEECLDGIARQSVVAGLGEQEIEEVLMVGGSSLLPGVYPLFEDRFGRNRVRAWQPFEAVAYGASAFAAESFSSSDLIVHDYAIVTHDPKTHEPQHTVVVPRGTRFPTPADLWKQGLVPTCSLGDPETMFKLVVCEIGRDGGERRFAWDAAGQLHALGGAGGAGGASKPLVVPLNASNPTLGYLDPPHAPSDRRPRLEIAFGVNAERWLVATVRDLRTKKMLMDGQPVVRLL